MVEEIPYDELIDETCPSCRHTVPSGTTKCPNCGYQIREEPKKVTVVDRTPRTVCSMGSRSNQMWFGGVLILMSGLLGVVTAIAELYAPDSMSIFYTEIGVPFSADIVLILGGITLIFGLVAIIGGVMALRGKAWSLAMAGGLLGTLAMGALFLGSLLGFIGLVVVATSKRYFSS